MDKEERRGEQGKRTVLLEAPVYEGERRRKRGAQSRIQAGHLGSGAGSARDKGCARTITRRICTKHFNWLIHKVEVILSFVVGSAAWSAKLPPTVPRGRLNLLAVTALAPAAALGAEPALLHPLGRAVAPGLMGCAADARGLHISARGGGGGWWWRRGGAGGRAGRRRGRRGGSGALQLAPTTGGPAVILRHDPRLVALLVVLQAGEGRGVVGRC